MYGDEAKNFEFPMNRQTHDAHRIIHWSVNSLTGEAIKTCASFFFRNLHFYPLFLNAFYYKSTIVRILTVFQEWLVTFCACFVYGYIML